MGRAFKLRTAAYNLIRMPSVAGDGMSLPEIVPGVSWDISEHRKQTEYLRRSLKITVREKRIDVGLREFFSSLLIKIYASKSGR